MERWRSLDLVQEAATILAKRENVLAEMNVNQLASGKGADGQYLPRYRDDPYFKTPEAAIAYEDWKALISPDKSKPKGVMDFFITGYTYYSVFAKVDGRKIKHGASVPFENSIDTKAPFAFGLNQDSLNSLWANIVRRELIITIKRKTGAK